MNNLSRIFLLGIAILLWNSCAKEEELTPTGYEKDWLVIEEPTSGDIVDELRYDIYQTYGVSIFYNDTLGWEDRVDMKGNPYRYYEILQVFYSPGNAKPVGSYTLLQDHTCLEGILNYFKDVVFDRFEDTRRLKSILFVDTVRKGSKDVEAFLGYNALVMKTAQDFETYDTEAKEEYANMFFRNYFVGLFASTEHDVWKEEFFQLTRNKNPACANLYSVNTAVGTKWDKAFDGTNFTVKEELGFIESMFVNSILGAYEATPTEDLDFESYVDAVLTMSMDDFEIKYGTYDVVMKKYHIVRKKIQEFGFKLK